MVLRVVGMAALGVGVLLGLRAVMTHSFGEAAVALLLTFSGIFMAVGEAPPFL